MQKNKNTLKCHSVGNFVCASNLFQHKVPYRMTSRCTKTKFSAKKSKLTYVILIGLFIFSNSQASDTRLKAMGDMTYSVPDIEAQVNLYQFADNIAGLKTNDSTSWMYYTANSLNNWGSLKRYWDARENQFHNFSFSGLKHLGENQVFYGYVRYNWDYRQDVNNAIEKEPYAIDPFVLADYTVGNFLYHGPEIFAAFNHTISPSFSWGIGLYYYINRGLKNIPTEPEIISREINASLDFIYKVSSKVSLGLSFIPYQTQDITKLVEQQNGLTPVTRRYRGEFVYREKTATSDRTAVYEGYQIKPQFSYKSEFCENISFFNYYYQWHKIFDGTSSHLFDGYFQAQHFQFHTLTRFNLSIENNTKLFIEYKFENVYDWAKEPQDNLLIFQAIGNSHKFVLGGSSNISDLPLLGAIEIHIVSNNPQQIDYLAHKDRNGVITDLQVRTGIEYHLNHSLDLRLGYIYHKYFENEIWNYYGDYSGSRVTFGSGWRFNQFELDTFGELGLMKGNTYSERSRIIFNVIIQLKQYF